MLKKKLIEKGLLFLNITFKLIIIFFLLSNCNFLTRFRYEKYECPSNNLKIEEIVINKEKVGSDIIMIMNRQSIKLTITESTKTKIFSKAKDFNIEVDRENGELKFLKNRSYSTINCKKSLLKF